MRLGQECYQIEMTTPPSFNPPFLPTPIQTHQRPGIYTEDVPRCQAWQLFGLVRFRIRGTLNADYLGLSPQQISLSLWVYIPWQVSRSLLV